MTTIPNDGERSPLVSRCAEAIARFAPGSPFTDEGEAEVERHARMIAPSVERDPDALPMLALKAAQTIFGSVRAEVDDSPF